MKDYCIRLVLILTLTCVFDFATVFSLNTVSAGEMKESSEPFAPDLEHNAQAAQPGSSDTQDGEMALEAVTYTGFFRISGSALKPRESSVEWTGSGGGGCIYASSGSTFAVFNVPVTLPQGSKISYFRMYFNDTNVSIDSAAWFTVYDLYGSMVAEWGVNSSGSAGNGYQTTSEFSHTIDYDLYSYVINWRPNDLGADMQICGFRLYYTPPASTQKAVFFPIVTKQ